MLGSFVDSQLRLHLCQSNSSTGPTAEQQQHLNGKREEFCLNLITQQN